MSVIMLFFFFFAKCIRHTELSKKKKKKNLTENEKTYARQKNHSTLKETKIVFETKSIGNCYLSWYSWQYIL